MIVREALAAAASRLSGSSGSPRLDAELLMAHALGVGREQLLLSHLAERVPEDFEPLLVRREGGEPVSYILGRRAFWTIELEVGPGVLVPRPDTETLMEAALDHFGSAGPSRVLDLGTGPGTLLLAALDQWPAATGLGIDRSAEALSCARRNAERLGMAERARFQLGDWAEGLDETFHLVLANPPYIAEDAQLPRDVADWEPAEALFAGPEGLDDYCRLAPQIPRLLQPGGIACLEIGAGQEPAVRHLFEAQGLAVSSRADLAGIARCLVLSA